MGRFFAVVVLGCMAIAQFSFADGKPQQKAVNPAAATPENAPGALPALPPPPSGRSTVIGGAIRNVDPVRDQLTLKVFGGQTMKIIFDERTRFYRDGVRTPLRDLGPDNHASVETVLDGTDIFARSIHTLSRSPEGESQGQVLSYNPGTGELTVSAGLAHEPIQLRVLAGTSIVRVGQAASGSAVSGVSDLVKGALVSVQFTSSNNGRGIARQISVIAIPGSSFVFSGNITFLDMHAHVLALVDPRDGKNYQIFFDPARFPDSHNLHLGTHVRVTANFDGSHYTAGTITIH